MICETLTNHDILRYPSSMIVLSIDHRVCFFNEYPRESEAICHFHARAMARRRKGRFPLRMCRILFATRNSWTALRSSRPLCVAVICRSRGGLSANEKKKKIASNYKCSFCLVCMLSRNCMVFR